MTISQRDRRALIALAIVGSATGLYYIAARPDNTTVARAAATPETIEMAEHQLAMKKRLAESVPKREAAVAIAKADLAKREKGLIQADTAAQAQAQILQVIRRIGHKQTPPLEIRGQEVGQVKPYGQNYGQVLVTVSFECQVDQLVNLLSDLGSQPELVASHDLRIGQAHPKQKTFPVGLTVAGLVPRKLVPERKEGAYPF